MPPRDIRLASTTRSRHVGRILAWAVGFAVVFALGIVIGTRLAFRDAPSQSVATARAAPLTGAAQEPGRLAPAPAAHTRAGAVAAAARSITAFGGDVLLEPARLRTLVARIASSASRARLIDAFEVASTQTKAKLGTDTVPRPVIVLRAVPAGYQVQRYSPDSATIAIWYVGVVGSGATVPPQQSWRTQTVDLVWERSSWKVDRFASTAGPTPALGVNDAQPPGELFAAIPSFREFGYGVR